MKSITIAGRIGKDAETRTTQGGDQVTGFTVAVDEGFGDKKRTLWFDVSFWGKRGASLSQYLTKGSSVTVAGEMSTREHDGKTYLTCRAWDVTLQGGKSGGNRDDAGGYDQSPGPSAQSRDIDDEIPF